MPAYTHENQTQAKTRFGSQSAVDDRFLELITQQKNETIERMLDSGLALSNDPQNKATIVRALSQGQWPCVERLAPDILGMAQWRKLLVRYVAQELVEDKQCAFFTSFHATRMVALPLEDKEDMRRLFEEILWEELPRRPQFAPSAPEAFLVYEDAAWLDVDQLFQEAPSLNGLKPWQQGVINSLRGDAPQSPLNELKACIDGLKLARQTQDATLPSRSPRL